MAAEDFEKTRALLKKVDGNGESVYDHLINLVLQIAKDKPENPLAALESISVQIKNAKLEPQHFKELPAVVTDPEAKRVLAASLQRTTTLVQGEKKEDEEDIKEREASTEVPDLMSQCELLEWAGVHIGREQMFKLLLSIQDLTQREDLTNVRFWGRLRGTGGDYWVVEAKMNSWPEETPEVEEKSAAALTSASGAEKKAEERKEAWGTGANEFAYFVSSHAGGAWTRLPMVLPEQIIIARQMRRFLTGDLKAPVLGFPRFPWGEASFVRAQIARISAATVISPKGFYALDDEVEEETLVEEEEFKGVHPLDLLQSDNWTHHRAFLLRQGRTQPFQEEEKEEDEDAPKKNEEEEEPDEPISLLSTLDKDESSVAPDACWSFRLTNGDGIPVPHAPVSAHSLVWPGATAVARRNAFVNVYIGWGLKYSAQPYTPPPPPSIQSEYVAEFNPEEGETDPLAEQTDPLPPAKPADGDRKDLDGEGDEDLEGDEGEGDLQ